MIKRYLSILFMLMMLLMVSSCSSKPKIEDYDIIHELEFGGVYIKIEIDDTLEENTKVDIVTSFFVNLHIFIKQNHN